MSTFRQPKQVRFATHKNTFHSPHTPPSLLTIASDSESSSSGPTTPPQMFDSLPEPFPYMVSHVPLYFKYANPLHYVEPLRPNQLLDSAVVNWDLMLNPSTITLNNCYSLSSRMLVEQATTPALPALSIISIHFPWSIDVHASNGSYVTLEDLFDSVYHSLRTNVTANEYDLLVLPHKDDKKRAARAYKQRYERIRNISAQDEEKRGGMKRIDFLMGRTRFHSISNTGRRSDEWRLDVT